MVLKLMTNIILQDCNLCIELCFYGVIEVSECRGNFGFVKDHENQSKMSMVINKSHKPSFPGGGSDLGWSTNITMDKSKRSGWFIRLRAKRDLVLFSFYAHITS